MPRGKFDPNKLQPAANYPMAAAKANAINKMISAADEDLAETRVNFRWGREQLNLVKRAAQQMGVPYQTYIKQVLYRQCIADLKESADIDRKTKR